MKEGIRRTLVFDLKDLRHEDFKQYEALVPPETLGLIFEEAEFVAPVSCTILLLLQGGDNISVTADITSQISVECRRCVTPFETDVAAAIDIFFSFKDQSSEEDEVDERYYDGETLDISEDVRQAVMLEIPMWSLCSETCEGLCPECGSKLNAGACACEIEDEAPVTASSSLSAQLESIFSKTDPLKDAEK